ncbi:DUF2635 domain-containing protein [Falsiroseomonas sp.]|uniref:DUF2635 domain-containing protein n=1 Tax=Falsiroseomonas sp. TaxID=2870721 RepID=UPI003F705749
MTQMVRVAPVEGRRVRRPDTGAVIEVPVELPRDAFVLRRLADGDLALAETTPTPATPPAKK